MKMVSRPSEKWTYQHKATNLFINCTWTGRWMQNHYKQNIIAIKNTFLLPPRSDHRLSTHLYAVRCVSMKYRRAPRGSICDSWYLYHAMHIFTPRLACSVRPLSVARWRCIQPLNLIYQVVNSVVDDRHIWRSSSTSPTGFSSSWQWQFTSVWTAAHHRICRASIPVSSADTRRHLRSANRHLLAVPRFPLNTYGRRAFSVAR